MAENTKAKSKFNKYIVDYEKIRTFLRYISYGCYSKQLLAKKLGQSNRKYDDDWARIKSFLPEDRLQDTSYKGQKYHSIKGDSYYGGENYLASTFKKKALKQVAFFYDVTLLQLLAQQEDYIGIADIMEALDNYESLFGTEVINYPESSIVNRYISSLVKRGLVKSKKKRNSLVYKLVDNPFSNLDESEVQELLHAISFYKNTALLSYPFYYLTETLENNYNLFPAENSLIQLKNIPFIRILDDVVVHTLLKYISAKEIISFNYKNTAKIALPLRIITDFSTGHQYLEAVSSNEEAAGKIRYRIDSISNIQPSDTFISYSEPQTTLTTVKLTIEDSRTADIFTATIQTTDKLKLLPYLRTLHPYLKSVDDEFLTNKLKEDIMEALKNYGY